MEPHMKKGILKNIISEDKESWPKLGPVGLMAFSSESDPRHLFSESGSLQKWILFSLSFSPASKTAGASVGPGGASPSKLMIVVGPIPSSKLVKKS